METIERAATAAAGGGLDADLADGARKDAHRLAGSLGSFGLIRGSELARELEERFETGEKPQDAAELVDLAAALRGEIER